MLSRIRRDVAGDTAARLAWPSANPQFAVLAGVQAEDSGAARRLAELEEQITLRVQEARLAGQREGEATGRRQAAADLQPVLAKLMGSIDEIASLRPRIVREAEGDLVILALAIARRILRRELTVDPDSVRGLVRAALDKLAGQEISRVRTHPELEPAMRRTLQQEGRGGIEIVADATLERGAVLVETARGRLDASIETQLGEVERGLADRLAGN